MSAKRSYLITGSSGIGEATALALAVDPNARFFLVSLDKLGCAALAREIELLGRECSILACDLTAAGAAAQAVEGCVRAYGRLDAVFNVAGASGRSRGDGAIDTCTDEGWDFTWNANITTQFRVSREAVRVMKQQDPDEDGSRGAILNMSSVLALSPEPKHFNTVAYAASKGATLAMTRTIAADVLRYEIRCNAVAPALVDTPMAHRVSSDPELLASLKVRQPLASGMMQVTDCGSLCAFLLSKRARYITGQTFTIDAGWSLAT